MRDRSSAGRCNGFLDPVVEPWYKCIEAGLAWVRTAKTTGHDAKLIKGVGAIEDAY